jgi:hypothetical protein
MGNRLSFVLTELSRITFFDGGCLRFVESSCERTQSALKLVLERPDKRPLNITVLACHLDALQSAIDEFRRRQASRPQPAPWSSWSHETDDWRGASHKGRR